MKYRLTRNLEGENLDWAGYLVIQL